MSSRRSRTILKLQDAIMRNYSTKVTSPNTSNLNYACQTTGSFVASLPRKLRKLERKPLVTSINELKRMARLEKQERRIAREVALNPPENGLLVKELIPVAHELLAARDELFACTSEVAASIPIYSCRWCGEVHVGDPPHKIRTCNVKGKIKEHTWERGGTQHVLPVVESFHLYDRLGRAVSHNERLEVDRVPAVVELCIQAGVDILEYPTRRRDFPVYRVAGRMIDFEKRFPKYDTQGKDINAFGFWENRKKLSKFGESINSSGISIKDAAKRGMQAWNKMQSGATKLMQSYAVQTCGYCPEVQVGPKGHRVRQCQAFKHQMRDGQHAWQQATVDDIIPPVYVWHVQEPQAGSALVHALKRYYGKLPALVELFAQAGAQVGQNYSDLMRHDVAVPELNEEKLVI